MKKLFILILAIFISVSAAFSQRILAGEVTYKNVSGLLYEFTIHTISFAEPANSLFLAFGDGSSSFITILSEPLGNKYYSNTYITQHVFALSGNYIVSVNCGDQMPGVVNSLLTLNDPFKLYCQINILDPNALGNNSAPVLLSGLNSVDEVDNVYSFSINAYDPDGDSLNYELSTFTLHEGVDDFCTIPEATNYIGIDSLSGDFIWDKPISYGRYFFAVKIYEYRNDINLGWTMRTYMIDHYDPDASHDIFIYPDPASDFITINFGQNYFDQFGVNLYTITGQKIQGLNY